MSLPPFSIRVLLPFLLPIAVGAQSTSISTSEPARVEVVVSSSAIATYTWPEANEVLPLEAKVHTQNLDGFPENILTLSSEQFTCDFHVVNGLVVAQSEEDASARLVSRLMPSNSLDIFLFHAGTFLPAVNETTLRGYQLGLEKEYGDAVVLDEDSPLIPTKTFSVAGNRWGRVHYDLPDEDRTVTEFFLPLPGKLLVLRLQGMASFVDSREPQVKRMLSSLDLKN